MSLIDLKVVIAAAGEGKRSGLNFPKTLYKINKVPILIMIIKKINYLDKNPTIIVSQKGKKNIKECVDKYNLKAEYLIQKQPNGMGNALLQFRKSKYFNKTNYILLIWWDIPYLYKSSINNLIKNFIFERSFFSLLTGFSKSPYTLLIRNKKNKIIEVKEKRTSNFKSRYGERDIGIFLFNKKLLNILQKNKKIVAVDGKFEHNFLYIVKILHKKNLKISNVQLLNKKEFISFNSQKDLK